MNPQDLTQNKAIAWLTVGFLALSMWNIWQTHRYRVMEFEWRKNHTAV